MRKSTYLAVPALAIGALTMAAAPATAHESDTWSTQTTLDTLNNSGTTGQATVDLHGNQATVTVDVTGAAETFMDAPFPHAQHIHIASQGVCPPPAADADGDGVVSTPEGQPFYGTIGTSLTTEGDTSPDSGVAVDRYPGGSSYTYERTIELDEASADSVRNGTGVVVVHGVDPTLLPAAAQEKNSSLAPELPLAATLPAACGTLSATQVGEVPEGGADTGVETTTGMGNTAALVAAGAGALVAAGAGALALHRRGGGAR